jgi:hypothetical protein
MKLFRNLSRHSRWCWNSCAQALERKKKGIDREAGGHSTWAIHEMATAHTCPRPPPPPATKNRIFFFCFLFFFIRRRATRRRPRLNDDDDDVWNPRPQSGNKKDRSSGSSIASRSVGFQEILSFSIVEERKRQQTRETRRKLRDEFSRMSSAGTEPHGLLSSKIPDAHYKRNSWLASGHDGQK